MRSPLLQAIADARGEPGAPALVEATSGTAYARDVLIASLQQAAAAAAAKAQRPGPLCLMVGSESRMELTFGILTGLCAGWTVVPLSASATEAELRTLREHVNPDLVWGFPADAAVTDRLEVTLGNHTSGLLVRARGRSPATTDGGLLVFTSGTTGRPKGVLVTPEMILSNVATAMRHFGHGPGRRSVSLLPLHHTFTVISDLLAMLVCGGSCVIAPQFRTDTLDAVLQAMSTHRPDYFSAVPVIFDCLSALAPAEALASCQFAISGAAPLHERTRADYWAKFGHEIVACYGLSEATCFVAATPREQGRSGSCGKPVGVELSIVDDQGRTVAPRQIGEIAIAGPSVMTNGYWREGRTKQHYLERGLFRTGDLGYQDEAGYVYISGRSKNMLIRGGEKVYLEDVDRCILALPEVRDAATVRVAASDDAEQCASFVVPAADWDESLREKIRNVILERHGSMHLPDHIVAAQSIPRSPTGKIRYPVLADDFAASRRAVEGRGA